MKRTLSKFSAALIFAIGVATLPAHATMADGEKRFSVSAGAAFPTSVNNFSDSANAGAAAGIQYMVGMNDKVGIGLQLDSMFFGEKDHMLVSAAGGEINATTKSNAASLEVVGRYTLSPDARFCPYLLGSLGMNYFHQSTDGKPRTTSTWADTGTREMRSLQDTSSGGFSLSLGAGAETKLGDRMRLGLEAAWHTFGVSQTSFGTHAINFPSASLRISWLLGN